MEYTKEMQNAFKKFLIINGYSNKILMEKIGFCEKATYQWKKRGKIGISAITKLKEIGLDLPTIYFDNIKNSETLSESEKLNNSDHIGDIAEVVKAE